MYKQFLISAFASYIHGTHCTGV